VKSIISEVIALEEAAEAHAAIERGGVLGRIVLSPPSPRLQLLASPERDLRASVRKIDPTKTGRSRQRIAAMARARLTQPQTPPATIVSAANFPEL
jgi:hypothetical protein